MKRHIIRNLLTGISLVLFLSACSSGKKGETFQSLKDGFEAPPKEYGTAPLYVWNTKITEDVIDRTMSDLKDKGFGGVFVHPRPGLANEYLSDNWFGLFQHTLNKGKELGMNVWIYDENSFPSGYAGGHVNAQMPESYNQGQSITLYRAEVLPDTINKFYLCLKEVDGKFIDITSSIHDEVGKKGSYYLYRKNYEPRTSWYGGYSYVDLLVPGVTQNFLEITGNGYEKVVGDEFGKSMPGWFTDEPHVAPPGGGIRWTPDLFDVFQKKWGYDLKTNLPSLSLEIGNWKEVRHNYYQTLLQLFIDRWAKPCFEYCETKNLKFTGHYWEHIWPEMVFGGDNMAMYAWHQMPGIDLLFNQFNEESPQAQFGNVRSVKELSSVANQMGYKRTLCETYGAGGWEETFRDFKRLGDWQAALGVNFMTQHLSHISIAGARKYDCPTSFSEHSPWWPYYKTLNMHQARLSMALSGGQQLNDILVLEPTTSLWFYYVTWNSSPKLWEIGKGFQSFITTLEKAQVEYDLGSENIIKDHGKVSKNKFIVGQRGYSKVVIPPLTENLDAATFRLLKQFADNGGTILAFSKPGYIDGKQNDEANQFFSGNKNITYLDQLSPELIHQQFASPGITFNHIQGGNLFHHRRILDDGQVIFFVNSSLTESSTGQVSITGKDAIEMNTLTGLMTDYPETCEDNRITIDFDIPPTGSLLLYVFNKKQQGYPLSLKTGSYTSVSATSAITASPTEDNVLAIDFCDLELAGKVYKDMHVFDAADRVYKHFGFKEGNPWGASIQYKDNIVSRDTFTTAGFKATYYVTIDGDFDRSGMKAVIEKPGLYQITVNGATVTPDAGKWWVDREFGIVPIGKELRKGVNTITIAVTPMKLDAEIEPIYILGNFTLKSVAKGWVITKPGEHFDMGSWKEQGWPFYSKAVVYSKDFHIASTGDYQVQLGKWAGTVAEVSVNGQSAGIIFSEPYQLDVSKLVRQGDNTITVQVVGSNKNLFGPFHNNPDPGFVFPTHFRNVKSYPEGNKYQQLDYGLMDEFILTTSKND